MNLHIVSKIPRNNFTVSRLGAHDVIHLENVSVGYRINPERIRSFKQYVINWMQGKVKIQTFWALQQVSITISRGEVFGFIGPNGAGKSTTLKLIARILKPTKGRVLVKGQVSPLLGIGAGFHKELTGRENVYLNGALLGFTPHEMRERFGSIVDFAELWDFIDIPMRTYSSGLWARLGFAVATSVWPDILIIDEILAVGDEAFKRKSSNRIKEYCEKGVTILLVSHSMKTIQDMCHRVAWLDHGQVRLVGEASEVIRAYRKSQRDSNQ